MKFQFLAVLADILSAINRAAAKAENSTFRASFRAQDAAYHEGFVAEQKRVDAAKAQVELAQKYLEQVRAEAKAVNEEFHDRVLAIGERVYG